VDTDLIWRYETVPNHKVNDHCIQGGDISTL